jgi:hypothetical protein
MYGHQHNYIKKLSSTKLQMSLTNILNNTGPSIEPCGTPL